jgi:dipeptidase E
LPARQRHVIAIGGGGLAVDASGFERYAFELTGASRPKVCFVPTAAGDSPLYEVRFFRVMTAMGAEPSTLRLVERDIDDLAAHVLEQDIVYVGGGNTANMLVIWRRHGLDTILRGAWEAGIVVMGPSAGGNCWFEASTTDSFLLGNADPLDDGLGILPGSFCPHYDGEPMRRPRYHELVAGGELPGGVACEDNAAVHFVGTDLHAAVALTDTAHAYRVEPDGRNGVTETALDVTALGA